MKGSSVALLVGGLYLIQRNGGARLPLNLAGQQPKASQQAPTSAAKGAGAPAGAGASTGAGRGGAEKLGGGTQTPQSLEDVFGTFDNLNSPSIIDAMLAEQNAGTDVPVPTDFSFLNSTTDLSQLSDIAAAPTGDTAVPLFGGDQGTIDPETGLVIDPATGDPFGSPVTDPAADPNVVDLTDQVNMPSAIPSDVASTDSPDQVTVDPGTTDFEF